MVLGVKKMLYSLLLVGIVFTSLTSCNKNDMIDEVHEENVEGTYVTVWLNGVGYTPQQRSVQMGRPDADRAAINYTFDGSSAQPVPKFDMKKGDPIKVAAVFVNDQINNSKTIAELDATITSVDDKRFTFECKKKIKLNASNVGQGKWYYMGIIGGQFDPNTKHVKFKTQTELRPFSRSDKNQKLAIESPFTTDWVEMKTTKNNTEITLRAVDESKLVYKARGIVLVMTMANETQMDVKIDRTFTLVTNNLSTDGYYDLNAADSRFNSTNNSKALWKTAQTPASEYYSEKQKHLNSVLGGLENSYRTQFRFMPGDDSKPGGDEPEKYMYFDKVKEGGNGEHIKLNRYYLAWVMPEQVGYSYSIMLSSAECTEPGRTKTTSTLPAELYDKEYSDQQKLPSPNTWKPDMSRIAIGGFSKNMGDNEDGKVFRLNMSLVRPMLPIERLIPNYWDKKKYSEAGFDQTLYGYFRSPKLNEITPITNTPISIQETGKFGEYTQPWGSHRYFIYSLEVDEDHWWGGGHKNPLTGNGVVKTDKSEAYSMQNLIGKEETTNAPPSSDYAAAYWIKKEGDRLVYRALYLGPHFTANYVTLFLVANPGFWGNEDSGKQPFFGRDATNNMTITRKIIFPSNKYHFWLYNTDITYITEQENGQWVYLGQTQDKSGKAYILPYLKTPSWGKRIKVAQ